MKKILIIFIVAALIGLGYWFVILPNLGKKVPSNPPTAEELKRIEEIERSSSEIAPNAVPGAGVRPVGSLPKPPEPMPESTSTTSATTSDITTEVIEDEEENTVLPE